VRLVPTPPLPDPPGEEADGHQTEEEVGGPLPQAVLHLRIGRTGRIADQDDHGPPGEASGGVVGQEPGIPHPGRAGRRGHDGAEEGHPAAEEHRTPATAGQEGPGVVETFAAVVEHLQPEDTRSEVPADLVPDAVTDDGGQHDDHEDAGQGDVAELRGDAGEHGHRLAREHEPDEQRVLTEDLQPR
jgi:hypothetical protein